MAASATAQMVQMTLSVAAKVTRTIAAMTAVKSEQLQSRGRISIRSGCWFAKLIVRVIREVFFAFTESSKLGCGLFAGASNKRKNMRHHIFLQLS